MNTDTKQEGEFKMPKPKKPKNLSSQDAVIKVDLSTPKKEADIVKVVIPSKEKDAVQEPSSNEDISQAEQPEATLQQVEQIDSNASSDESVIEEVTNNNVETNTETVDNELKQVVIEAPVKQLPENIEKLVSFMEETGGTVEDYVRLNTDYSNVDEKTLLREYYSKTKPHLDKQEIQFLMEDSFEYDEDLEEERDIRKKKLAFKEEVAKAKNYLDSIKTKYYEEIKMKPGVSKEQQEAFDFFNRYKKTEESNQLKHEAFKQTTKKLFTDDFKGFEYNVGEKRFRYNVQNSEQLAEKQSDINNFIGKFLDKEGKVSDPGSYHKALYTAMNSDKIAQHFYEQGKADEA